MDLLDLDALLVTSADNARYLTGQRLFYEIDWFTDAYAVLLPRDGEPISLTGNEDYGFKHYPFAPPGALPSKWAGIFVTALKKLGVGKGGKVGLDYLPFQVYNAMTKLMAGTEFVSAESELLLARAIKNPEEVKLLRRAAEIVSLGLEAVFEITKPGISEREIFAKANSAMTVAGSEGPPFFSLCGSGERTVTDSLASDKRIREGEVVTVHLGSIYGGYIGDGARSKVVGSPSPELKQLYRAVYKAVMAGVERTKPGTRASDVDHAIRQSLIEAEYHDFANSSGHGVGLRVVEFPWIDKAEELGKRNMELRPNMVFGLEPRAYKDGLGAVEIEDMVLVTDSGSELLTKYGYESSLIS